LTNTVFLSTKAYNGGTIYLNNKVVVTISGITVTDSEARGNGGFIYAEAATTPTSSSITFSNTNTFSTLVAQNNGGMFYVDNNVMDISMACAITVTSSISYNNGGVFYILNVNDVTMTGNTYTTFSSLNEGSHFYSEAINLVLSMTNNVFNAYYQDYV
jgi:hypothetical protein